MGYYSAETKRCVRYSIYMSFFLSMIIQVQLLCYFGAKYSAISFPEVPKPQYWQYLWLASLIPGLAGYLSLNRNRVSLLTFYYKGTVVLGLGTILGTMVLNATDLLDYAKTKETSSTFHDFPIIVIWYIFLFICIQIQAFGIYNARILLQVWNYSGKKK
jgi:hypothetical protein